MIFLLTCWASCKYTVICAEYLSCAILYQFVLSHTGNMIMFDSFIHLLEWKRNIWKKTYFWEKNVQSKIWKIIQKIVLIKLKEEQSVNDWFTQSAKWKKKFFSKKENEMKSIYFYECYKDSNFLNLNIYISIFILIEANNSLKQSFLKNFRYRRFNENCFIKIGKRKVEKLSWEKKLELVSRWRCYSHHMLLLKSLAWFSFLIILLNCDCTWSWSWSWSWSWTQSKVWKINSNQHGRETFVVNIFFKTEKTIFFSKCIIFLFYTREKKRKWKINFFFRIK